MVRIIIAACLVTSSLVASAAEPKRVHPADYRIRVSYNEKTLAKFRNDIAEAVEKALHERARRLELSREMAEDQIKEELDRYHKELEALEAARGREVAARSRGDLDEAARWSLVREERRARALDLARRTQLIEQALMAESLKNWRMARDREKALADRALKVVDPVIESDTPPAKPSK